MVMVTEGGRTNVHVQNNADGSPVYKEGKLMCVGRPRASGVLFRMTLSALCVDSQSEMNLFWDPLSRSGTHDHACTTYFIHSLPGTMG